MNLSRDKKNKVLIVTNGVFLLIKMLKHFLFNVELMQKEWIWVYGFSGLLLLWLLPIYAKLKHALLFLATGGVIGITVGMIIGNESLIVLEYIWLVFGVIAMIVHYSKSNLDEYTSS